MKTLLILLVATLCRCETTVPPTKYYEPLPRNVQPIHYDVKLNFSFNQSASEYKFTGSSSITFKVLESTQKIVLHSANITHDENVVTLENKDGIQQETTFSLNNETEEMIVQLKDPLIVDEIYNLTFKEFNGVLNFSWAGFNMAKYNESGTEKILMLSQFEKYGARQVMPCFDEPYFKTMFSFTIVRPAEYFTLFTTKRKDSKDLQDGSIEETFYETPIMASYSLAIFITQYNYTEKGKQRFYARPEAIQTGSVGFAMDIASDTLDFLEKYFTVKFGLDKIHHIAVPSSYFRPNGMENYGLIAYQERSIMANAETNPIQVTETVAHEIIHQWFGNLVTMDSWSTLWLKEGFASYLAFYFSDKIKPEFNMMNIFIYKRLIYCFPFDMDPAGSTMSNTKNENAEVYISYLKAPVVIHTLRHALGDELFKEALNHFLEQNKYKSVSPKILYSSIQEVIDQQNNSKLLDGATIDDFMTAWDTQIGFPLVTANLDYTSGILSFKQERFMKEGNTSTSQWILPINFGFSSLGVNFSNTLPDFWLKEKTMDYPTPLPTDGWFILNKQFSGYMRVNYNRENWIRLAEALDKENYSGIHPFNRQQLISDSFALAESGKLDYEIPLRISWHLKNGVSIEELMLFFDEINELRVFYGIKENRKLFEQYITIILEQAYEKHGCIAQKEDSDDIKNFKNSLLEWLVFAKHENCSRNALEKYNEWKTTFEKPSKKSEEALLCAAIELSGYEEYKFLYEKFLEETDKNVKYSYAHSLSCTKDHKAINEFVNNVYFGNVSDFLNNDNKYMLAERLLNNGGPAVPIFIEIFKNQTEKEFRKFEFGYTSRGCTTPKLIEQYEELSKLRNDTILTPVNANLKFLTNFEKPIRAALQELLEINNNNIIE